MTLRTRSIHRKLILRLSLAAVLLAAILGAAAFYNERRQLGKRVAEMAQQAVDLLKIEVQHLVEKGVGAGSGLPFQEAMENLVRTLTLPHSEFGRLVFVTILDASRHEVARLVAPDIAKAQRIAEAFLQRGFLFPENGIQFGAVLGIADTPDIPIALNITDVRGKTIGYANGVFVLSPATASDLHWAAVREAAVAVAIVFVTALVVYPLIRGLFKQLSELTVQLLDAIVDTVKVLGSAIAKRDSDTEAHNFRVTLYSVRLAEAVGLEAKTIRTLIKGALLHDVGKIGVRDPILLKPGPLNKTEFATMQDHVRHGLDIIGAATWLANANQVVGYHHEKYDGSGYPRQLKGEAIPITARIFAIADVFDALTSERPYKKAFDVDEALAILRQGAGSHFDPRLITVFERLAPTLFASFANREAERRIEFTEIVKHYFQGDLGEILEEARASISTSAYHGEFLF